MVIFSKLFVISILQINLRLGTEPVPYVVLGVNLALSAPDTEGYRLSRHLPTTRSIMTLNEILNDPGISYWLKDAIKTAYERDPIDALHDARRLLKMLGERYTQIVNRVDRHVLPGRVKLVNIFESTSGSSTKSIFNDIHHGVV